MKTREERLSYKRRSVLDDIHRINMEESLLKLVPDDVLGLNSFNTFFYHQTSEPQFDLDFNLGWLSKNATDKDKEQRRTEARKLMSTLSDKLGAVFEKPTLNEYSGSWTVKGATFWGDLKVHIEIGGLTTPPNCVLVTKHRMSEYFEAECDKVVEADVLV